MGVMVQVYRRAKLLWRFTWNCIPVCCL